MKAFIYTSLVITSVVANGANADEFDVTSAHVDGCPANFFTHKAEVFDAVTLCATYKVPGQKLAYAANVTAQWLDNDQDGVIDEPALLDHLRRNQAVLVMSKSGFSDGAFDEMDIESRVGQDLSADETNPSNQRDASQEEIHHLIVNAGWQSLYPKLFSDQKRVNSALYQQWKVADELGYYQYDDPTCDSACKTIEFFYLTTASYLGSKADLFSDELSLKTREELTEKLLGVVAIMESKDYHYSTHMWPDGKYPHQQNIKIIGQ
ncbi:hypothetical protein [Vibrio bivalvicida]|uniref:Uncharacterized protein n=1 Tax=Vibrio bivalvicida TaxID=1276888 RepID=A0A177XZM0_9VIBR|nr:hypothetical protein [Vibrio bivalvicida]OAJ94027.1 hypothetical protein APB76_12515 [Vibrio bivalvicida]